MKPQRHVKFSLVKKIQLGLLLSIGAICFGIWIGHLVNLVIGYLK